MNNSPLYASPLVGYPGGVDRILSSDWKVVGDDVIVVKGKRHARGGGHANGPHRGMMA